MSRSSWNCIICCWKPGADLTDRVGDGDDDVVEDELGRVAAAVAELVQGPTDREAGSVRGHDDLGHPLVTALVGGADEHADPVGLCRRW